MDSSIEGKRVVVLSDSDLLYRAIELHLARRLKMEVCEPVDGSPAWGEGDCDGNHYDLMVVALGAQTGEPVAMLARASLAGQVGQVPLLIISDRPFDAYPGDQIMYLPFPFHPDELRDMVQRLVSSS